MKITYKKLKDIVFDNYTIDVKYNIVSTNFVLTLKNEELGPIIINKNLSIAIDKFKEAMILSDFYKKLLITVNPIKLWTKHMT